MSSNGDNSLDEIILGGSAYEFINTDEESRDDNTTESIASTDFGRFDETNSLRSTEFSGEDNIEGNNQESRQSTVPDEIIPKPSLSSVLSHDPHINVNKVSQSTSPSIEFEESFDGGEGKIYVKHTVAELEEEQISNLLGPIPKNNPKNKVLLCVRQTMTDLNLSIKEPLRILYVGSHLARQDIIHKIASSVIASAENGMSDKQRRYSGSQHYNVIPISAFGSENAPEIELMHSSRYQIKVDSCYSAYNLKSEKSLNNPDVIKLVLDDEFTCHSIPSHKDSFYIEPSWELPHIAIIYCSGGDDINIKRTRALVRKFLNRHHIPSILISQILMLDNFSFPSVDQHSIHMCLESKDPKEGGSIIHQRFPINLDTFLNVDARQINRNLAYLTGLHEPICIPTTLNHKIYDSQSQERDCQILKKKPIISWGQGISIIRLTSFYRICLLSFLFVLLTTILNYVNVSGPTISLNNKIILNSSSSQVASISSIISPIILATSKLFRPLSQDASSICYMSFGPKIFSESFDEGFSAVKIDSSKRSSSISFSCTAETYGEKNVLIRILGNPRFIWPKSETISINIFRDNKTIDTDRAFGNENCLVLLIPRNEAYGVINVSINSEKKLRLNKTCTLNFGSSASQILQIFKNKMSSFVIHQSPNDGSYPTYHNKHKAVNVIKNIRNKFRAKFPKLSDTCNRAVVRPHMFGNSFTSNAWFYSFEKIKRYFFLPCCREIIKKYVAHSHIAFNIAKNYLKQSKANFFKTFGIRFKAKDNLHVFSSVLTDTAKVCSLKTAKKISILFNEINTQAFDVKRALKKFMEPQHKRLFAAQVKSKVLWLKAKRRDKEAEQYQKKAMALMQRYSKLDAARNETLILNTSSPDTPIASRRDLEGALLVQGALESELKWLPITALGLVKISTVSSAQKAGTKDSD
ncbi:hypothetical protein EPUL_002855, partial [Erysiphe pulchra]